MLKLLLVSPNEKVFNGFESVLIELNDIEFSRIYSGQEALGRSAEGGFDLVVADENLGDMTGLEFAGRLLAVDPMINCALTSSLPAEVFHEKSEGLGLMAQLSNIPNQVEVESLLESLKHLKKLLD